MADYENTERIAYDYAKFPREFISYRWFKPILVAALAFVFYFALVLILAFAVGVWTGGFDYLGTISEGYDGMDVYTGPGALIGLGTVALMMPALALAGLIVRDRPFSSYLSSRGGWNWKTFLWCLLIAVVIMAVDFVVEYALFPTSSGDGLNHFTAIGIVLCIVLIPFQCVAEEVIFRGFILQTVSSWTKLPIVGIIISAIAFAAGHPYNLYGVIVIFLNGIFWGFVAWKSNGLEATSALHIVNNFVTFLTAGFGLSATTSEVPIEAIAISLIIDAVYAVAVLGLGKKFGWFEPTGDGAAKFNEKTRAKLARKQQRRGLQDVPQPPLAPQAAQVPRVQQAQQVWQAQAAQGHQGQPEQQPPLAQQMQPQQVSRVQQAQQMWQDQAQQAAHVPRVQQAQQMWQAQAPRDEEQARQTQQGTQVPLAQQSQQVWQDQTRQVAQVPWDAEQVLQAQQGSQTPRVQQAQQSAQVPRVQQSQQMWQDQAQQAAHVPRVEQAQQVWQAQASRDEEQVPQAQQEAQVPQAQQAQQTQQGQPPRSQ